MTSNFSLSNVLRKSLSQFLLLNINCRFTNNLVASVTCGKSEPYPPPEEKTRGRNSCTLAKNSLRVLGQREAKNRPLYFKLLHFTCVSQLFDLEEGVLTVLKENVNDTQLGCKIFMTLSVRRAI